MLSHLETALYIDATSSIYKQLTFPIPSHSHGRNRIPH